MIAGRRPLVDPRARRPARSRRGRERRIAPARGRLATPAARRSGTVPRSAQKRFFPRLNRLPHSLQPTRSIDSVYGFVIPPTQHTPWRRSESLARRCSRRALATRLGALATPVRRRARDRSCAAAGSAAFSSRIPGRTPSGGREVDGIPRRGVRHAAVRRQARRELALPAHPARLLQPAHHRRTPSRRPPQGLPSSRTSP